MSRGKVIIFFAFVLVLGAGVVLGRLWPRLVPAAPAPGDRHPSWIADQLNLTPEQRTQMDAIWAETRQNIRKLMDQRHAIDRDRDQALRNLLTDQQKDAYDKIYTDARAKRAELEKCVDKLIHDAEERSRAMLDERQKARWETLQRDNHRHHWFKGASSQRYSSGPATSAPEAPSPSTMRAPAATNPIP